LKKKRLESVEAVKKIDRSTKGIARKGVPTFENQFPISTNEKYG